MGADAALIMTEWPEIKNYDLSKYEELMKEPLIYDGRNCYKLSEISKYNIIYNSIGRGNCSNNKSRTKKRNIITKNW